MPATLTALGLALYAPRLLTARARPVSALNAHRLSLQSLHEPAVADDERLSCQGIRLKRCEEQSRIRDVLEGRKLPIHGFPEHDVADYRLLRYPQGFGLHGDLLVNQRSAHETRADDVCPHAVLRPFFSNDFGKPDEAMFGGDIGRLEDRCFLRMDRAHVDDAAAALSVHLPQR